MSLLKKMAARLPRPIRLRLKTIYYAREAPKFWEPDVEPLKSLVRPGDIVVDLGANIGDYTFLLANLTGAQGKVYSVEPVPETFEILSGVVKKLALSNVELFNCAVSEKDGTVRMEIPLHQHGGQNFYMSRVVTWPSSASSFESFEVPCRALDSLLASQPAKPVTFVKCDVEGHELAVVKGASNLLERNRPAMLIEVAGTAVMQDDPDNQLFSTMNRYGYTPYWFDGKNLRPRTKGHWSVNYFFLQADHLRQLVHLNIS
jgi:FkbM family methyltransferase